MIWGSDTSINTRALDILNSASTSLFTVFNNGQASSTNLIVSNVATTTNLQVTGSATSTFANGVVLGLNGGQVGVGTTTQDSQNHNKFSVVGGAYVDGLYVGGTRNSGLVGTLFVDGGGSGPTVVWGGGLTSSSDIYGSLGFNGSSQQVDLSYNNSDFILSEGGISTRLTAARYTGNIGISTTTPWARLSVAGSSTLATQYAFAVSNISSTTLFTIANNGQASSTNLIVSGTATTSALVVTGSGTTSFTGPIAVTGATSSFSGLRLSGGCLQDSTGACVGRGQGATYVVAASSSIYRNYADYVATGTNDQNVINNAITAAYSAARGAGGKIYLLEGQFAIGTSSTNGAGIHMATGTQHSPRA
jgi:hypothetical protein